MPLRTRLKAAQPILIVLLLAGFLRAWAVSLLPQDFDEPTYLQVGFDYASQIRAGNFDAVIDYPLVTEHPAFVKLLYAGAVLLLGKAATWTNAFYLSRAISAVFGILAVAFVGIAIDPLAAGMLAVHTLAVKYTSQVYLEAVPSAMSIAAVLAFLRVKRDGSTRWLWLSAVALGIATASKYSYTPVVLIVLAYLALFEKKLPFGWLAAYSFLAIGTFFALDVSLWHDPLNRLLQSLSFHVQYSQGAHVQEVGYPWYQPFIWIFTSAPAGWHPNVFFYFGFDGPIAILAVAGLPREWTKRRWLVIWFAFGLAFLLAWPTKWPQYALILTPALCMMGAGTLRVIWKWLREQETYWDYFRNLLPAPTRWFWWTVGLFALFIAAIYLSAAVKLAVGRIGWSHMTAQNTFLPSNTINDLLPLQDGKILIATDRGAAIYSPTLTTDQSGQWIVLNQKNSGLAGDDVRALAVDSQTRVWFGTTSGVSQTTDYETWTSYTGADLGLTSSEVVSLAAIPGGEVVAGTSDGASVWDGNRWTPISQVGGRPVFSLATDGRGVWIGTATGAGRLDTLSGSWSFYPTPNAVKHILIDSTGAVWAATAGNGLARLENGSWHYYTTANSGLPLNLVNWVAEVEPGKLWLCTSLSSNVGGEVVAFDGTNWTPYTTDNSGASGSEPMVVVRSTDDQIWVGTASRGLDIFKLGR
ncbi:MAG TPA: two-component regulator propeller domain-containing protein [Anaerolineales bacterium]|nr:two-component regulator propeller domain-containing protein [Anaerolineales bacterium]